LGIHGDGQSVLVAEPLGEPTDHVGQRAVLENRRTQLAGQVSRDHLAVLKQRVDLRELLLPFILRAFGQARKMKAGSHEQLLQIIVQQTSRRPPKKRPPSRSVNGRTTRQIDPNETRPPFPPGTDSLSP